MVFLFDEVLPPVVLGPILSAPFSSLCLLGDILPTWEYFVRLISMMPVSAQTEC